MPRSAPPPLGAGAGRHGGAAAGAVDGGTGAVRVYPASAADAADLAALARATFPLACPPGTATQSIEEFLTSHLSPERFRDYLADPAREVLLASAGGVPMGYSMTVHAALVDPAIAAFLPMGVSAELSKFYVVADHHGKGVAATLMSASLAAAARRGTGGIWLGVNQRNARAIRFYRKNGFEIVGAKTFWVGPELHHDHVLARELIDPPNSRLGHQ